MHTRSPSPHVLAAGQSAVTASAVPVVASVQPRARALRAGLDLASPSTWAGHGPCDSATLPACAPAWAGHEAARLGCLPGPWPGLAGREASLSGLLLFLFD